MTIPEYFNEQEKFFLKEPISFSYWEAVYDQSIVHTSRRLKGDKNPLIKDLRPNESETSQDYRNNNERPITRIGFDKYVSKVSRVIRNSNIRLDSLSPELTELLEEDPFIYSGENLNIEDYALDCLFPLSLVNPNRLLVAFPYNPAFPDIPPSFPIEQGGHDPSTQIGIDIQVIDYKKIKYVDDHVFVFEGGKMQIQSEGNTVTAPYFFAADSQWWWYLEPYLARNQQGGIETRYNLIPWYFHETGASLVNFLPGEKAVSGDGENTYLESFILGYFILCDEFVGSFSDNQVVRNRFSYPITAMKETKCWNPKCKDGYIDGIRDADKADGNRCPVCRGENKVSWPSPMGIMIKRDSATLTGSQTDMKRDQDALIDFYHPELGILDHSWKIPWELWDKAKREIGLDLMEGTASESGKAKDLRMEALTDKLVRISKGLYQTIAKLLWHMECLINPNPQSREVPRVKLPMTFKITDMSELKENAKDALPVNRIEANLNYLENAYSGDNELLHIYKIALYYSPLLTMSAEERKESILSGAFNQNDVIRSHWAVTALMEAREDESLDILSLSNEEGYQIIEDYLSNRNLLQPEIIVPFQNQPANAT